MVDPLTRAGAARLLLLRRRARETFYEFCKFMDPAFYSSDRPYLVEIANILQENIYPGSNKKVMISMPPRSGKSYIVSLFCAWLLGHYPDGAIMRNCYGAELAEELSGHVRGFVISDKYKSLFPNVEVVGGTAKSWKLGTAKTTSYFCGGVGGPITGKGCNIVAILDDPVKNLEDAWSSTLQEKTWSWKLSTHNSRLETGCPEIIIATRWSRKDPSGMSLLTQAGQWIEIKRPALLDNGKSFCEAVKTTAEYAEIKRITDAPIWEAEYQQTPIEVGGLLYPEETLNRFSISDISKHDHSSDGWDAIIGYTDTADEGADYLCSIIGKVYGQNVYISDVVYSQEPVEITEGLVAQQIIDNRPDRHIIESNNGGRIFALNIRERVRPFTSGRVEWRQNTSNKLTRMAMKSGKIRSDFWFRDDFAPGSDYDRFFRDLTNMVRTGKNSHDDAGDAITGLAETLETKRLAFA